MFDGFVLMDKKYFGELFNSWMSFVSKYVL